MGALPLRKEQWSYWEIFYPTATVLGNIQQDARDKTAAFLLFLGFTNQVLIWLFQSSKFMFFEKERRKKKKKKVKGT